MNLWHNHLEEKALAQKRAWLYVRTTYPDVLDSYASQLRSVRNYAKMNGFSIVGETIAFENGRFLERDGLSEVSDAVEAGKVDVVVVQNLSRIAKTQDIMMSYYQWLKKHNVELRSADEISLADVKEYCAYVVEAIVQCIETEKRKSKELSVAIR